MCFTIIAGGAIMKQKILFDRYQISYQQYKNIEDLICDNDINQIELLVFLSRIRLSKPEMVHFMQGSFMTRQKLLLKQRQLLLDKIHEDYRLIDQLDEMLHQLKETGKNE